MRSALILALIAILLSGAGASGSSRQLRVAYVTDVVASPSPHTLRGSALLGFERAVKQFHVQPRVVQFDPRQGAGPAVASLARQGYDLVLVGEVQGGLDMGAVLSAATKFSRQKIVLIDPPYVGQWPKNVQGSIWRVEEPAYLAGYLAGLMEKRRPGTDVVGSVGGYNIDTVNAFIAGFQAGAKKADPRVATVRGYTRDFFDAAKCKSAALREIAQGAGVLLNVAGVCGLGTLDAAKERHVWGVGVDVDQSYLGPEVLTSVLKRFDIQVYDTIKALVDGKLKTGTNAVWNLRDGAVGLGKISPKVPRSLVRRVDAVRRQIIAGKIKVPARLS